MLHPRRSKNFILFNEGRLSGERGSQKTEIRGRHLGKTMSMNKSPHRKSLIPNHSPKSHKETFKPDTFRGKKNLQNISFTSAFASGTERFLCWCLLTYYFDISIIGLITERQMLKKMLITFPNLICKQAFISCLSRHSEGTLSLQIIVLSQWYKPLGKVGPSQNLDAQCHWTQQADN